MVYPFFKVIQSPNSFMASRCPSSTVPVRLLLFVPEEFSGGHVSGLPQYGTNSLVFFFMTG